MVAPPVVSSRTSARGTTVVLPDRTGSVGDALGVILGTACAVLLALAVLSAWRVLADGSAAAAPARLSAEAITWLGPDHQVLVYRDGRIDLYGATPDDAQRQRLVTFATAIVGPAGIDADELVVDPSRAPVTDAALVRVADPVLSGFGEATVADGLEPVLAFVAAAAAQPNVTVTVTGHTDDIGEADSNLALSQARADAVIAALLARGVDPARISAVGAGETQPIAPNDSEAGRAVNRRIEVRVTGLG